ncbi:TolB family protein [Micromonosporaceae bacterium Da 78-11]
MNLEDTVRAAVHDLAEDAPPAHDLATVARVRGRRLRRRRQTGLGLAALALIAVTVTPYAVLHRDAPAPTPLQTQSVPTEWWQTPYRLPGGMIVTALTRKDVGAVDVPGGTTERDGNVLLNRETGRYTVLPSSYYTVYGAPAGEYGMAANGTGGSGIIDAKGGRGIWMDLSFEPRWSSDGSRILFTTDEGFAVMDAATGKIRRQALPAAIQRCPDDCIFSWLPGDQEVALARVDPDVQQSESKPDKILDIAVYSAATGKRVRIVPVAGVPFGPDAWSPDGNSVLVQDEAFAGRPKRIADVATGKIRGTVPGMNVHFLPNGKILSLTDEEALLYDADGKLLQRQSLPADFKDRTASIGTP